MRVLHGSPRFEKIAQRWHDLAEQRLAYYTELYRSGRWTTPIGQFITSYKRPTRHMAAGDIASNGFDLPGVPWVLYITKSGISFHGTYWHNDYGRPRSHGCINLTPQASKWLYRWTMPTVKPGKQFAYEYFGTAVHIFE